MNTINLPNGWAIAALENVCEVVAGNPAPQGDEFFENGLFNFVRVQDMGRLGDATYLKETKDRVNERATPKLRLFPKGSVLFTKSGASTLNNQRAILGKDSYVVSHIAAAIPESGISNEWIYFALVCVDFANLAHSSVMPSLPLSKVKPIQILVPPTNEQYRIVAKIEELISELDKGIESLKIARVQLKVYRQSLLKHAFEGKLTARWREQNPDKLETAEALLKRIQLERAARYQQQLADWQTSGGSKPKAPKSLPPLTKEELAELPELPEGWGWVKYGDLCSIVRNGISAKPEGESGTPIFRISAVRPLFFDMTDIRYIDNTTGEFDAYCLKRGDLVFTRYNGSRRYVGVCAEYRSDEKRLFPDKLVQTRIFSRNMSTSYLEKALNSGASRKFVESKIRTTAGQSGVSGDDIKNIPVPFCPAGEQMQIVDELESKLSEVDQLEQTIAFSLQQSEALRQSILKKAFSGQLVPQDPHDEPASALLARIKAEQVTNKATAKPARVKIQL